MKNKSNQSGSMHLVIILIVALSVVAGLSYVFWQNYQNNDKKDETTKIEPSAESSVYISDINTTVRFSNSYNLVKSTEENRAGSLVAYSFENKEVATANEIYPSEILIYTKESIDIFNSTCESAEGLSCFEGYYPSTSLYDSLYSAWTASTDYKNADLSLSYKFRDIGNKNWLVATHDYSNRKAGADREYLTFIDDKMVCINIHMSSVNDYDSADEMFDSMNLSNN